MKVLKCEGSSDDTFGVYGAGSDDDHDNCASGSPICFVVESKSAGEALMVVGQYAPGQCAGWLIGIAPYDVRGDDGEDVPIPTWPMRFERSKQDYSPRLVIEAPDDVTVIYPLTEHD